MDLSARWNINNLYQFIYTKWFNLFRCDRILWHGDGIAQLSYFRGESKFSDHRPVCGSFNVVADLLEDKSKRRASNTNIRIGAEELLPTRTNKVNKGTFFIFS
jgi:hypothetical protein